MPCPLLQDAGYVPCRRDALVPHGKYVLMILFLETWSGTVEPKYVLTLRHHVPDGRAMCKSR